MKDLNMPTPFDKYVPDDYRREAGMLQPLETRNEFWARKRDDAHNSGIYRHILPLHR